MRSFLLLACLFLLVTPNLFAGHVTITANRSDALILDFDLGSYRIASDNQKLPVEVNADGDQIAYNNLSLPGFSYLIQVPEHYKPVFHVEKTEVETHRNVSLRKIDDDIIVTGDDVSISAPFIMRNSILSTVYIQPFAYKDTEGTLQVMKRARITVDFIQDNSVRLEHQIRQTHAFKNWLSRAVLNYRDTSRDGEAKGSILMIYNSSAAGLSYLQPLIDWKHQKGWEVHAVSTQTTGSTTTSIKSYIQNAYNTWTNPPEYVLMIGKVQGSNSVVTYWEYYNHQTVGDFHYVQLDGSDLVPDAYIGRMSFTSTTQLSMMVNRIISYEKQTDLIVGDWYNRAILCPDNTDSGPSCTTTIDWVKDLMLTYNPTMQYTYINSGTFPPQIDAAMFQGASNFYYRGHNGYSGLTSTDVNNTLNNGMYPFMCFITCFSGNFGTTSGTCIGDMYMQAGTSNTPRGGIGFIGASCETHTCLNNIMTGAVAYGFFNEGLTNQGQATLRAKLGLLTCYPQYPDDYIPQNFQSINLLGDPSIDIWQKQPTATTVTHESTVSLTNGKLKVMVNSPTGPVENAWVCLLKGSDEIFQTGYTNANGEYIFQWATATAGTAKVTVTKPNYNTYQGSVTFASQTDPLSVTNTAAFSALDSGTAYTIPLSVKNTQYTLLSGVTATISSTSQYVYVTSPTVSLANIAQNQTVTSTGTVAFKLSNLCPEGTPLAFSVLIQGMNGSTAVSKAVYFQVNETGPDFQLSDTQIGTDDILMPGESSQVSLQLENQGTVTATNITGRLSCSNPNITVSQPLATFNNLSSTSTSWNTTPFSLSASNTLYTGTVITLILEVNYNNASKQILTKDITIGSVGTTSMTGPDDYGYICVANSDNNPQAKAYNWVEINPSAGGAGTSLSLSDTDTNGSGSYTTITTPFPIRYYGQMYNQLTICSNGFIMPGSQGSQEWMNWVIPGPMVPRPMIAPFWDDLLILTGSSISHYYDAVNHRLIVEWYNLKNRYDTTQNETFQVIFYDVLSYPTPTGDNAFLFQYNTFNNVDQGNYGVDYVDHGQYASVGIADQTGNTGIGYTYQNTYPTTCGTIVNHSTLYFTTIPTYSVAPSPVILSCPFTETNPVYPNSQIDAGETVSLSPVVSNAGVVTLINTTVSLETSDPYITIVNGQSTLMELTPDQNSPISAPFVITIASECPNMHQVEFTVRYATRENHYESDFNLIVHSNQIAFSNLLVNGQTQMILEPGITVPVSLQLQNISTLPISNGLFTLQPSTFWSATPTQFDIVLNTGATQTVQFNLLINNTAQVGNEIALIGNFTITGIYDSLFTQNILVGSWNTMLNETFEESANLNAWTLSPGVSCQPAAHINETGSEIAITPIQGTSTYELVSPVMAAQDCQRLRISFSYCNLNPSVVNTVAMSVNGSNTWQNLQTYNTLQSTPACLNIDLTDLPTNLTTLRFKWITTLQSGNLNPVILDDIQILGIHHPAGYLTGQVTLENPSSVLQDVKIYAELLPGQFVHPDATGHYQLPLYQGTYGYVKAELEGYIPDYKLNVDVLSGQTSNDNFQLAYIQKPVNLTSSLTGNIATFNWQLEPLSGSLRSRTTPEYYRIAIDGNNGIITDTTSTTSYTRYIPMGEYSVRVCSVCHDYYGNEVQSGYSNAVSLICTDNNDPVQIPQRFTLDQNYPNPFNPETTIRYALPIKGNTTLSIYNLKGQLVTTLVHEVQNAGYYQVKYHGTDQTGKPVGSGVYLYRLTSGSKSMNGKMILLK